MRLSVAIGKFVCGECDYHKPSPAIVLGEAFKGDKNGLWLCLDCMAETIKMVDATYPDWPKGLAEGE